jgi:hypothetical protein
LSINARTGHRWRLWLGLLVVACGITVTLALVLGGRTDAPADPAMQQTSDRTGTSLLLESGRSVPKLLLRRPPVERVAAPVLPEQTSGNDLAPTVTSPAQTKDQQSPPDAQVPFNIVHNLAQRLHDIAGHLKRVKTATGSGGSVP